jgi:hypothetical protein
LSRADSANLSNHFTSNAIKYRGKRSAARFRKTGTGFAGAKLSEILLSPRDARVIRMTRTALALTK